MNTDERAIDVIDDVEHDCPVLVGERVVAALRDAGIELFEAAPAPRQETSQ